jgi:hypothetical protein
MFEEASTLDLGCSKLGQSEGTKIHICIACFVAQDYIGAD